MPKITSVKAAIEQVFCPAGYSKTGWEAIREAASIQQGKHNCTPGQERRLWIAAAIRRAKPQNQPVTDAEVTQKLVEVEGDLSRVITGYIPVAIDPKLMPASVEGWELPGVIEQWTNYRPNDNRLRDWCKKLGFRYSRMGSYSASQVSALIDLWRQMRSAERDRSRSQAYKNFGHRTAA